MTKLPLVSVIIPTYNAADYLPDALQSVRRQEYAPLEIIVVDDGSTDATPQLIAGRGSNVSYVRQDNRGPAAARNRGLQEARGEVIAFLDADDVWPDGTLARQIDCLLARPEAAVALGRTALMGAADAESWFVPLLGSAVFRRDVFDRVGRFDETLRYSEDHDWFLRAREAGIAIAATDAITLHYRDRPHSLTSRPDRPHGYQLPHVLKRSLERRRKERIGPLSPFPGQPALDAEDT